MLIGGWPDGPPGGLLINIGLAIACFTAGFVFAVPLALLRLHGGRLGSPCATAIVEVLRATPLLLLLFWCHFALPVMVGYSVPSLLSSFLALTLYSTAYQSEIVRAGFSAVPSGEVEAALALGLSIWQTLAGVVIPQGLSLMAAASASFGVSLFKDTAVIYVVGVVDLMQYGLIAAERHPSQMFMVYLVMAAGFTLMGMGISFMGHHLERQFGLTRNIATP